MWNKGPAVLGKMSQTPIGIPKFTPKEMADLIAYLYFLHFIDEPGNPVNREKNVFRIWMLQMSWSGWEDRGN